MRKRTDNGQISVNAIAGSHVVLLGMDARRKFTKGLLGFAIHREDHTEDEAYWLKGFKRFKENEDRRHPGQLESTRENPIQGFLWGDYTVKPDHIYTYQVVPLYGKPKHLTGGKPVEVTITSEPVDSGEHAIYFNRGVAASQAYSAKFGARKPHEVPDRAAYKWLSRGLEEGILEFIGQAKGNRYALRAAVYEFSYLPVLRAFKRSAASKADVQIIYDARTGKGKPVYKSDEAIKKIKIRHLMIPRRQNESYISHNKFIVLLKDGKPIEVLTGSTNFTEGGIFGHSNVAHIIREPDIADKYYEYWLELSSDPDVSKKKGFRSWNARMNPVPKGGPSKGIVPIFSPRNSLEALDWYAELMSKARSGVCFTAAFGVNSCLVEILRENRAYLRHILLERPGKNFKMITENKDVRVAFGEKIGGNVEGMIEEWLTDLNEHVRYVHTKYMLIDPLSDFPTTITGSANFSKNSVKNNDENMIVDYGNTRLADCYLCEFMRLWNHFYFRNVMKRAQSRRGSKKSLPTYLQSDDSWTKAYYDKDSLKWKERLLFKGRGKKGFGISFFDIDETIFHTFAKIYVKKNGRVVRTLNNMEYNTYRLKEGESFDFREFKSARRFAETSKIIRPTLAKMKAMTRNALRAGSTIALLTARGTFPDMKTFKETFRKYGIPIDRIEINFAGDISAETGSTAEAKKRIVEKYLATGIFKRARLLDDNTENLQAFLSIAEQHPSVDFQAFYIDTKGKTRTIKAVKRKIS